MIPSCASMSSSRKPRSSKPNRAARPPAWLPDGTDKPRSRPGCAAFWRSAKPSPSHDLELDAIGSIQPLPVRLEQSSRSGKAAYRDEVSRAYGAASIPPFALSEVEGHASHLAFDFAQAERMLRRVSRTMLQAREARLRPFITTTSKKGQGIAAPALFGLPSRKPISPRNRRPDSGCAAARPRSGAAPRPRPGGCRPHRPHRHRPSARAAGR